jgi:hypothetical protein
MNPINFLMLWIHQIERRPEDLRQAAKTLKKARFKSKLEFEQKYHLRMYKKLFNPGDLILVRNTQIEKELNRKTKPWYLEPFVIERQTKGGSHILKEMNGTLSRHDVAAFRLIPYISHSDPASQEISDTLLTLNALRKICHHLTL